MVCRLRRLSRRRELQADLGLWRLGLHLLKARNTCKGLSAGGIWALEQAGNDRSVSSRQPTQQPSLSCAYTFGAYEVTLPIRST